MAAILKLRSDARGRPVLRGQEHYWSVVLELTRERQVFTSRDVALRSSDPKGGAVEEYLRRLERAGFIERAELPDCPNARAAWRLVRRQADAPRLSRDGTELPPPGQQLMWNTIRNLLKGGFDARELAQFASTDEVQVSLSTAKTYVQHLIGAGYLHVVAAGGPGRLARLRLIPAMNTGPAAPRILRTKAVYDPNRNDFPAEASAEEVRP